MREKLLHNIESIAPLPESVQEVEAIYRDVDSTFLDMQRAIEKDPLLSAHILKIANSPLYGMKTKIVSLHKAIALLGKGTIRTFVLSSAIDANFEIDLSPYGITAEEFKNASQKQMALALSWLKKSDPESASLLGACAFLGDIGRLLIAKYLIEEQNETLLQDALSSGISINAAEQLACESDATEVSAALFEKWNLDSLMTSVIAHCEAPAKAPEESKRLAAQLKVIRESVLANGLITEESLALARGSIVEFGLDLESFEAALVQLESLSQEELS